MPLVWAALLQAGARPMGQAAYEVLRVEAGYAAHGHELSLEYIPLETGLHDAVSFTKGCYVGQEIISRMDSRKRLAKQLRGLRLSGLAEAPARLAVAGKEAGDLTSVVQSPRFGPIGLAYVRTAHAEPGTRVEIADSDVSGEVVALPFGS
jgi:aminomethyltransferase